MRRIGLLIAAASLIATACAGAGDTPAAPAATAAPSGDTAARAQAPDFELALAGGGTFALADEEKPVYMVFWAEW